MNPLYRGWWRALMDLRPLVRFLAERFPRLAPWAVRTRSVGHIAVGNPIQILAGVDALLAWLLLGVPARWMLAAFVVVVLVVEVTHRVFYRSRCWLIGWREAWRFRRRFPADWATVAAKTMRVQAEVGTSKEPIASAVLRPIADHPKLSWWPQVEWPVVSWWVGPPPGRSFSSLDELTTILAANISRIEDVHLEYERENDSHGRLVVSFGQVLDHPSSPTWSITAADQDVDDLASLEDFEEATDRHLRLIDGEAS